MLIKKIPGILLCALIAIPAWFIGSRFPVMGSPVAGLLLGMALAFWKRPDTFKDGIAYSAKKLLQYSIILLGFDMNLYKIVQTGQQALILLVFTLTVSLLAAYLLGKLLKVDRQTNILVGVGTAICGGSAIAAAAPAIRADDQAVARAISTTFLFNVLAAFIFPAVGHAMGMTDVNFGLWAGTAINDTSSVVAAGYAFSDAAGDLAVIVKLTRTLMIIPITLVLALNTAKKQSHSTQKIGLAKMFPWFVLGFVAASVIGTFLPLPAQAAKHLAQAGKFIIVMAMAGIGLNTNLISLIKSGWRPLLLGLGCWVMLATASLLVQYYVL